MMDIRDWDSLSGEDKLLACETQSELDLYCEVSGLTEKLNNLRAQRGKSILPCMGEEYYKKFNEIVGSNLKLQQFWNALTAAERYTDLVYDHGMLTLWLPIALREQGEFLIRFNGAFRIEDSRDAYQNNDPSKTIYAWVVDLTLK